MKVKFLIIIFTISFFSNFLYSQGYEIKVQINGVSDTVVYLGYHRGERKLVADTTYIDNKGRAVFSGDESLLKGIYFVVMPSRNMSFFEILMPEDQFFSIRTDTTNFVENMKVSGCRENRIFNEYQRYMVNIQKQRSELNNKINELDEEDEDVIKSLREELLDINEKRKEYIDKIIKKNPNFFFTKVLLAMKDIEIPDSPKDEDGEEIYPNFRYHYFKNHYFDNIDFSESGLIRTPILFNKVDYYFNHMVVPNIDSLRKETDYVINLAYESGDSLVFRAIASHLLRYFESSKIMGYDGVFVHIAEQWYLNNKAYWADEDFIERLTERVMKISPNLIGNIAPNLVRMQTIDNQYISLHQVQADYTVLIFFEPDCGHCRRVMPVLFDKFQDSLIDINTKVFALYTQYDREEWREFLDKHDLYNNSGWYNVWDGPRPHSNFRNFYDIYSTPVIYILADNKRIVAKRIGVDDITQIIELDKKIQEKKNEDG